jgi:hypothetical protein
MTSHLESRLKRLEEKAGSTDQVGQILDSVDLWTVDALLLQVIALIGEATGELESGAPTDAMLRTSIYNRQTYDEAIAKIAPGTIDRLLGAFIANAGEGGLLDEVLACRALRLRWNRFTQLFPDQDITSVRWPLPPGDDDVVVAAR